MAQIISITSTSTDQLLAYVGRLFTDTWLLIAIAIGVPLAFYVIKKAIGLVPKGR